MAEVDDVVRQLNEEAVASMGEIAALRAEIERLTVENERLRGSVEDVRAEYLGRFLGAKAEIERLRAALQEIYDLEGSRIDEAQEVARRALEQSPRESNDG